MNRRTFLLTTGAAILGQGLSGCNTLKKSFFFSDKSQKFTKVVDQLDWIDDHRRQNLALNSEKKDASDLNKLVPEINEIELLNIHSSQPTNSLRIIAWNTERGRNWREGVQLIESNPALKNPDIILLGEMDLGMARSYNEHTTKELAAALSMNYAYGVEFLELTKGEAGEREKYPGENEWGYHGNAILAKYPLQNLRMIRFPGIEIWYNHYQKRLGGRMALFADIQINGKVITFVSTHLESTGNDEILRKSQMNMILKELKKRSEDLPVVIGGDFNATPDESLFKNLKKEGFLIEECNEIGKPTQQQFNDGKVFLVKKQIDYITIKNLEIMKDNTSPKVVPAAFTDKNHTIMLSDHAIVTVKVHSTI